MSDRNWEQELKKIDKQLASVSDEQLLAQTKQERAGVAVPAGARAPTAPAPKAASSVMQRPWMAWVQLTLAIAGATGLWFWPWPTRCGVNAMGFTAATGVVTLLGLWSAIGSWRHRQGRAHILSFAVMIWGLVLGAREVLPRVGYAIPTVDRAAGWSCTAPVPTAPAPAIPTPAPTPGTTTPPPAETPPPATGSAGSTGSTVTPPTTSLSR